MSDFYILVDDEPVQIDDMKRWATWFENADRQVALDYVETPTGTYRVSTVFLGFNHSFTGGTPVLWETMVFQAHGDFVQTHLTMMMDRYISHAAAVEGHARMVATVREAAYRQTPDG